ncbi:hypothetical protein KM043_004369 [Ampulex compressa]|nr:hypothetical protein KM043_004369 [Ampulex compressa]
MVGGLLFCACLMQLSIVSGDKNNITIRPREESWISNENLATVIKHSFPFSRCCNIYISESINDVEVLFNQFINIYPSDYLVRRKIYECQGYFLLAPTVEEIVRALEVVPSIISTTEILVIIDGIIEDDSNILNISLYENADTNIVSRTGMWSLSENYLHPRTFYKVHRYEDMIHRYSTFDFRGRELQVSTFYRPPVSYVNTTVNRTINGVEAEVYLADSDVERDGIEMKLFLLLAEKLNFTWTIRKPNGLDKYGRRVNKTTWVGGVIEMLQKEEIDMTFASIWLTEDHIAFINLTEPWYQLFIHFLVPRPRPTTSFWALTRPFSVRAWFLLICTMLFKTVYMCVRSWIDPKFPKRFRNFIITLTELTGRLLGNWVPRNVANVRLDLHLWQTAGLVIVTAYSSSLAARLASSEYEPRIDTIQQFLEANLTWGRYPPIPPFHNYFDLTDPYSSQLPGKYILVKDETEEHELIRKGKYAIIGRVVGSIFFPEDQISNEDLKSYRVMKDMVGSFYACFAVRPWLLRPINTMLLWLKESGITFFHLRDVIRRRASFNLREVLVEQDGHDGSARVLSLTPLGAGFSMLLVGLMISTFVFYLELRQVSGSRPIRAVLRDIDTQRKLYEAQRLEGKRRKSGRPRAKSENINCERRFLRFFYEREDIFRYNFEAETMVKKHIDDVQPETLDEHFRLLIECKDLIDTEEKDVTVADLPEWYDEALFKKGQQYYMQNLMQMGAAHLVGLLAIICIPETLRILVFTKQSSTVCLAYKRYAQTLIHVYGMSYADPGDSTSKFYKSLNVIRRKHVMNSKRSQNAGFGGIHQKDMAITQFGFIGYVLLAAQDLGLSDTFEERKAYIHFWRVTGHLLGIDDRINICRKSVEETTELCKMMMKDILKKEILQAPPEYLEMLRTIVDGMWYIDITLNTDAFIALTYRLTGIKYEEPLSWITRLSMKYRELIFYTMTIPFIGTAVRMYFNKLLLFVYWLVETYSFNASLKFGKKNARLNVYPKMK